jgi:hypothetical protein
VFAAAVEFFVAARDPWRGLTRALSNDHHRAVLGRLAIVDIETPPAVMRSATTAATENRPEVAAKAYALLASETDNHRKAIAYLVLGKTAEAEHALLDVPQGDRDAAYWNDLSVVLTARVAAGNDETLIEALAAADRAFEGDASTDLPARFNRAMIDLRLRDDTEVGRNSCCSDR